MVTSLRPLGDKLTFADGGGGVCVVPAPLSLLTTVSLDSNANFRGTSNALSYFNLAYSFLHTWL